MSIFGSIIKGITGPLRGVGNFLQGKFRKGIGAFGDTAKVAAPLLGATGVGAPLAAGIGAAGGAASTWGEGEDNFGHIIGGGAKGAAGGLMGHMAGKTFPGIKKFLSGGGGGAPAAATATATPAVTGTAATAAPKVGGGVGSAIGGFIGKNPEIAAGVLSTGANVYGAHKQGQAMDRQLELEEQIEARRAEQDPLALLFSLYKGGRSF